MQEIHHQFPSYDQLVLFAREYLPETENPRGNLVFVHGACEHGGRYGEFAHAAMSAGWRVLIVDLRGHGQSSGIRVHLRSIDEYINDVLSAYQYFQLETSNTVVVSHSMGGLVTARLLARKQNLFRAACFLSPFFGLAIPVDRITWIAGWFLSRVWPSFRFPSRVDSAQLSADSQYLRERRADPLIEKSITAGWFFAIQRALTAAEEEVGLIQLPTLVLQGDADRIVQPLAAHRWCNQIASTEKLFRSLPGHLHELLREPDRDDVTHFILEWLGNQVDPKSANFGKTMGD